MGQPDPDPTHGEVTAAAVEPPAAREERLASLDLVRGFCILGILLVNISFFMAPTDGFDPRVTATWWGDHVVAGLALVLANGKMISQLAILFGAGLALQCDRARAAGRPFVAYYLWRQILLFLIGLAHALLLWYGDILTAYAITGMIVLFLSRLPQRVLVVLIGVGMAWVYGWALLGTLFTLVFVGLESPPSKSSEQPAVTELQPTQGDQVESTGSQDGQKDPFAKKFNQLEELVKPYWGPESELRIYQQGTWSEMVLNRALNVAVFVLFFWIMLVWELIALFLAGLLLLRHGAFHDPAAHRPLWRRLIVIGLAVGVPLQLAAVLGYAWKPTGWLDQVFIALGSAPLAFGYLGLLVLWSHSGRAIWLQRLLQTVGRMALTNYLLQSVLCGFVFYSYGLALFGKLGQAAGLLVVLGIWTLELAWSPLWLRYFHMGPVEWAWRSLADRRVRPLLRRPAAARA